MRKKVSFIEKFTLVTLSAFLSLMGMEMTLKYSGRVRTHTTIFSLKGKPYLAAHSPYLPFSLPKNISFPHRTSEFDVVYDINNHGYRGEFPRVIRKPSGMKRILMLGDSFTLGWGNELEHTFVQQVQDHLDIEQYSVINTAYHAGYSPDSYYAYLIREGVELSPDMVIVVLYTGNDIRDIRDNKWLTTDERGAPTSIVTLRLYMDYKGNLIHQPGTLDALLPWNYKLPVLNNSYTFIATTQLFNKILSGSSFSDPLIVNRLTEEEAWRRFCVAIKSIDAWSGENGVGLVFVMIPPDPRKAKDHPTNERIARIINSQSNFHLVDMRPHLAGEAYFDKDAHLNRLGNRIVAKNLIEYLEGTGFITARSGDG